MPISHISDYFLEEYIRTNRDKSRYSVDLYLLEQGYSPEDIEAVWKYLNYKKPTFSFFKIKTWKYVGETTWIKVFIVAFAIVVVIYFAYQLLFQRGLWHGRPFSELDPTGSTPSDSSIAFSPDGTFLATGNPGGVQLWSMPDQKLVKTFGEHVTTSEKITWSPDGKLLATTGPINSVNIWQVDQAKLLYTFYNYSDALSSFAFSPKNSEFALVGKSSPIQLYNLKDGSLLASLDGIADELKFTSENQLLARSGNKELFEYENSRNGGAGKWSKNTSGLTPEEASFLFTPSFPKVASPNNQIMSSLINPSLDPGECGNGSIISLSRIKDNIFIENLEAPTCHITKLAFNPDGSILAASSKDGIVRIWYLN